MAAFETMIRFLESTGIFTYLALLLLFIVLYYLFLNLLKMYVQTERVGDRLKMVIAFILAALLTVLAFYFFSSSATAAGSVLGVAVFVIAVIFVLMAAGFKLGGIDIPSLFRK